MHLHMRWQQWLACVTTLLLSTGLSFAAETAAMREQQLQPAAVDALTFTPVGSLPLRQAGRYISTIAISNARAYVFMEADHAHTDRSVEIFDIADPQHPTFLALVSLPLGPGILQVQEAIIYAVTTTGALWAINVAQPDSPQTQVYTLPGATIVGVHVQGSLAYLALQANGLRIATITPQGLVLHGAFPGTVDAVMVAGTRAFVLTKPGDLAKDAAWTMLDVTDVDQPVQINDFTLYGWLFPTPERVYGFWDAHLEVRDLRVPTSSPIGSVFETAGSGNQPFYGLGATDLVVVGDLAYIANRDLYIIDVSRPDHPFLRGAKSAGGYATNIAIAGDLAFVGVHDAVQIMRVGPDTSTASLNAQGGHIGSPDGVVSLDLAPGTLSGTMDVRYRGRNVFAHPLPGDLSLVRGFTIEGPDPSSSSMLTATLLLKPTEPELFNARQDFFAPSTPDLKLVGWDGNRWAMLPAQIAQEDGDTRATLHPFTDVALVSQHYLAFLPVVSR